MSCNNTFVIINCTLINDYNLDMYNITVSKCEKVLEIYTDEKLSFKEPVYVCANKASRM